jgi:hypothetical protein
MPLRLLVVHSGADFSTNDVAVGYAEALQRAGHDVGLYALNTRLRATARYMGYLLAAARRNDPSVPRRATLGDVSLKASEDIVLAALRGRVDAVLLISGLFVNPAALRLLRAARIPVGIVFTESPYQDDEQAFYAELVSCCWTNERTSVDTLRRLNARTWYLPASYRDGFHVPAEPDPAVPAHDVVFVGTYFAERLELLAGVDWAGLGIDLGLYGSIELVDKRTRAYKQLAPYWCGGSMDNAAALALYRRAKVTLNLNRSSEWLEDGARRILTAESLNPRAYELAAAGCFQVAEHRAEYRDVFDDAVPTFTTAAELSDLIGLALAEPAWRWMAATNARRAVGPHTFDARAAQVVAQLGATVLNNPFTVPRQAAAD